MTYCDVFSLKGSIIENIGNNYPVMKRRLHVAGCRGMLKDALVAFEHVLVGVGFLAGTRTRRMSSRNSS